MNRQVLFFITVIAVLISCSRTGRKNSARDQSTGIDSLLIEYASGFEVEYHPGYKKLTVKDPWQKAKDIQYEYYLFTGKPDHLPGYAINVQIPVDKVVCLSTTHIAMLDFIGGINSIAGISGSRYITNSTVKNNLEEQKIRDIGNSENLNYESLISIDPDVIFVYGVSGNILRSVSRLEEMGLTVVFVGDYLENSPLGKMEWVKFMAAFYNKEKEVAVRFDSVAAIYNSLASKAADIDERPEVMLDLPWNGTWYVSGGNSYIAKLIDDAGGDYLWKDRTSRESQPLGLELIFDNTRDADYWLNPGNANSLQDIGEADSRFTDIKAYQYGNVYNNNARVSKHGGNDYFESGIVHPDIILADMISIFHPHILPDHELYYYQKLP